MRFSKRLRGARMGRRMWTEGAATGVLLLAVTMMLQGCTTLRPGGESDTIKATGKALSGFHYTTAEKFWKQGNANLAIKYLQKAIENDPLQIEPRLGLIDIYMARCLPDEALITIRNCPEEMQEDPQLRERLVFALELQGDSEGAAAASDEAVAEGMNRTRLLVTRAEANLMLKDFSGARELYEEAIRVDPADWEALRALSKIYSLTGLHAEAGELLLRLIVLRPEEPQIAMESGLAFEEAGLIDDGIRRLYLHLFTADGHQRGDVGRALGYLYFQRELWPECLHAYTLAREVDEGLLDVHDRMRLAEALLRTGEILNAATELQSLLDRDPDNHVVRAALALAYWKSGQRTRAEELVANTPRVQAAGEPGEELLRAVIKRLRGGCLE